MQLGNPLPVLVGIPLMACFCWLLDRRLSILDSVPATHAKTLPLDGLRGILASSVFFHHAYISYTYFRTGNWDAPQSDFYAQLGPAAVTMFFFISGFLFWGKMLKNPASITSRKLIPNRIRRIMPAYLAAVLLMLVVVAFASDFHLREPLRAVVKECLSWCLAGFPFLGGPPTNGFSPGPYTGGIYWTLQLEWLFYLLLPALVWFRPIYRFPVCILAAIAAFVALSYLHPHNPYLSAVNFLLIRFAFMFYAAFSIGMLAAYGQGGEQFERVLRSSTATTIGILLFATQAFVIPSAYTAYEPILLAPVFFMIAAGNSFFGVLSSRPFRALGTVSYSLYVFHGILLHLLVVLINHFRPIQQMAPLPYWGCMLVAGLLITLWAALSYKWIEKPFFAKRRA